MTRTESAKHFWFQWVIKFENGKLCECWKLRLGKESWERWENWWEIFSLVDDAAELLIFLMEKRVDSWLVFTVLLNVNSECSHQKCANRVNNFSFFLHACDWKATIGKLNFLLFDQYLTSEFRAFCCVCIQFWNKHLCYVHIRCYSFFRSFSNLIIQKYCRKSCKNFVTAEI